MMSAAKIGNELGRKSTYQHYVEQQAIPSIEGYYIPDIRTIKLASWHAMGGLGAYLHLEGSREVNDAYVCEIPPGEALKPQKHLFEVLCYIVSGRGATSVWHSDQSKQTFEWHAGSLFSPPLNTWYQHFNGQGDEPARLLAVTTAPTVMNLFHNLDFVFNSDYPFTDRYNGESDYFSGSGKALAETFWESNFVADVRSFQLQDNQKRGAGGKIIMLEIANNLMSAHISQFPVGTYKKAHRHGAGSHVVILGGEGFSLMWPEGHKIRKYDWGEGSLLVPPERWFHQHFNVGAGPARYLALKPFNSRKFPGLRKLGSSESVKAGGDQIEYEDEDPVIRKMFEEELAKRGVESRMQQILKT
jgi:quercetin dioxygenase-like cupin family protein